MKFLIFKIKDIQIGIAFIKLYLYAIMDNKDY